MRTTSAFFAQIGPFLIPSLRIYLDIYLDNPNTDNFVIPLMNIPNAFLKTDQTKQSRTANIGADRKGVSQKSPDLLTEELLLAKRVVMYV